MVRWPAATRGRRLRTRAPRARRRVCTSTSASGSTATARWRDASTSSCAARRDGRREPRSARQLEAFRRLMGRDPTHLDSHQHVAPAATAPSTVLTRSGERARRPRARFHRERPLRGRLLRPDREGRAAIREAITAELARCGLIGGLPPGVTELGCHPGGRRRLRFRVRGRAARLELDTLCDPRVAGRSRPRASCCGRSPNSTQLRDAAR